ncbi:uncharacterized protein BDR25DRAFT_350419 [Lindgomyces ingoldianus]|uniref:Uncharacterized protein n=1 Tax=Lindgomyces ingoldianus TaxID=673940 RepID=A0ACB6RCR6_9PLEO|nr:uncharacterized protein BDR25DRAFT_350419 [Lindgomyces ingoldianus]KAF2476122.1 hypothetical protein BDR25DRAFT_350419 [Lindgomyces ingoldianus]
MVFQSHTYSTIHGLALSKCCLTISPLAYQPKIVPLVRGHTWSRHATELWQISTTSLHVDLLQHITALAFALSLFLLILHDAYGKLYLNRHWERPGFCCPTIRGLLKYLIQHSLTFV